MTHICVSKLIIIGSDNGLSPGRRQAIIWTNAGILLIGPLGTNFNEILIEIHIFSFKKMHLKMLSGKRRPFCLGLNVLTHWCVPFNNRNSHTWLKQTMMRSWHGNTFWITGPLWRESFKGLVMWGFDVFFDATLDNLLNNQVTSDFIYQEAHVDGLVQDCSNSSALAMELLQSCTKPSM